MSGLFSLSSILNENNTFRSIIKTPVNETYLNSSLSILEKFNTGITESTKVMYSGIGEATSRSEENEKFAEYFKNYKSLVNDYTREMNELVSRFAINVSTYIDANQSIIDNADGMSVTGEPSIKVYDYQNLDNDKVPNINVEKAFKKEFKFIGKMMQDLGNAITDDEAKANVLATVCNNLADEIQDGWLEKCMCKIADIDDDEESCKKTNFASMMYKKFIPDNLRDMNITSGDIQQARLALMNASALVDGIEKANAEFASGLEKVSDEIGGMFFRNQDGKMPIKTDEEGIADRDYKLNPSSFNQFNIFMANKCTQITELCNLYLVAIGIKADMIYKYLKQCVDIIETAMNGVDYTPNDDNAENDNSIDDPDQESSIGDDNESEDDDIGDIEIPNMDDNSSILGQDLPNGSDTPDNGETSDGEDNIDPEEANKSESEFDEASYLFDANIFELERIYEQYELQRLTANYIGEAAGNSGFGDKIRSLINKIVEALQKFFDFNTKSILKYVKQLKDSKYQNALKNAKIPDGMTIDWIDTDKIEKLTSSDSGNFTNDLLDDKFKYIKDTWKDYLDPNASLKSLTDDILNTITKKGSPYTNTERENSIKFLLNYETVCNNTKSAIDKLKNDSERDIKAVESGTLSVGEAVSTFEQTLVQYFTEADQPGDNNNNAASANEPKETPAQQNNQSNKDNNDNKSTESFGEPVKDDNKKNNKAKTRVNNYYTANIQILSSKLNIMKKTATKQINFLTHILAPKDAENDNQNQQQNNNDQNQNNNTNN